MRIYLSGPMTGLPDMNIPHFAEIASALRLCGHEVTDPAVVDLGAGAKWEDYMRVHIASLCRCDAIAMLKGWQQSRGAKLEHQVAVALGMPVHCAYELSLP